jgi:hypothetical protein
VPQKSAALSLLHTEVMLALLGTRERIVIEGRFARVDLFTRTVATLRRDCNVYVNPISEGAAFGPLGLTRPDFRPSCALKLVPPLQVDLLSYRAKWLALAAKGLVHRMKAASIDTMGESQMGRYSFSSWTIHMASIIASAGEARYLGRGFLPDHRDDAHRGGHYLSR